jgi:hypothetical protein
MAYGAYGRLRTKSSLPLANGAYGRLRTKSSLPLHIISPVRAFPQCGWFVPSWTAVPAVLRCGWHTLRLHDLCQDTVFVAPVSGCPPPLCLCALCSFERPRRVGFSPMVRTGRVLLLSNRIIPVRCFTCGKVIGNKYNTYLSMMSEDYKAKCVHMHSLSLRRAHGFFSPSLCQPASLCLAVKHTTLNEHKRGVLKQGGVSLNDAWLL